jgi:hypothetical protein
MKTRWKVTAMSSSFDFDFSFLFPQYEWNKMNKFQLKGSKLSFHGLGGNGLVNSGVEVAWVVKEPPEIMSRRK